MKDIEIYFIGGTCSKWEKAEQIAIDNLLKWLDDKEDTKVYVANFSDKKCYLRKENILFINVLK